MDPGRTRVLVVDDHQVFTEALAGRLRDEPGMEVVGTANTSAEAWSLLCREPVDVLLLDLDLAGEDGLELGRSVLARWPRTRLVVVTGSADSSRLLEAVQVGVVGWVVKSGTTDALLRAVTSAARGETYIPASLLTGALAPPPGTAGSGGRDDILDRLSDRELQVLRLLMGGLSRPEIAERLAVSPNTVRTHVQRILHKLEVSSALMAVTRARQAGLAPES